jgi:hypothetical protein
MNRPYQPGRRRRPRSTATSAGRATPVQRPPCLGEEQGPGALDEFRRGSAEVERWLALGPHALLEERGDGVDGKARAASHVRGDPPEIATAPREGPSVQAWPDQHRALREGACLHDRVLVRRSRRSRHRGESSPPAGPSHARLTGISRYIDVGRRRRDDVAGTHRTGAGRPAYAGAHPAYRLRMLALGLRMLCRKTVPAGGRRLAARQRPGHLRSRGPKATPTRPGARTLVTGQTSPTR